MNKRIQTSASDIAGVPITAFKGRANPDQGEAFAPEHTGESVATDQLKSIVERIERMKEDRQAIADDIREIYGEAKFNGFDVAVLRKIIALRKKPALERAEEDAILELYLQALGMS